MIVLESLGVTLGRREICERGPNLSSKHRIESLTMGRGQKYVSKCLQNCIELLLIGHPAFCNNGATPCISSPYS